MSNDSATLDRFWAKVDVRTPGECWEWQAARLPAGYGRFWASGHLVGAHRFSLEAKGGPLDPGALALHRCDNPPCVNPAHLFAGSHADNDRDMRAKGREARVGAKGTAHGSSKLTEANVLMIRSRVASGATHRGLGREFGVDHSLIGLIARRKLWAHLPG